LIAKSAPSPAEHPNEPEVVNGAHELSARAERLAVLVASEAVLQASGFIFER
jgi:hypothetical protein